MISTCFQNKSCRRLRKAMLELCREKSVKDIKVKELCELSDVSESSFYNYYRNIFSLADDCKDALSDEIFDIFSKAYLGINAANISYMSKRLSAVLPQCTALCDGTGDYMFFLNTIDRIRRYGFTLLENVEYPNFSLDMSIDFLISGAFGMCFSIGKNYDLTDCEKASYICGEFYKTLFKEAYK